MTLRNSVENSNKTVDHWTNQTSKLIESNRNIEMNYDKLMMKVFDIDEQMSETTRICTIKKQELEDSQHARMISSRKQWYLQFNVRTLETTYFLKYVHINFSFDFD